MGSGSLAVTRDQILQRMESRAQQMTVYQPGPEWMVITFAAIDYYLPPDIGGKATTHPVTGNMVSGDGTLKIKSRYGQEMDPRTKRPMPRGPVTGQSSLDIASFMVDNFGHAGVTWLDGDRDDEKKLAAKRLHLAYRKDWAEEQVKARSAFAGNWIKSHPGQRVPPATRLQKTAQKFLDELSLTGDKVGRFVCKYNCMDTDDFAEFSLHMKAAHGQDEIPMSLAVKAADLAAEAGAEDVTAVAAEDPETQEIVSESLKSMLETQAPKPATKPIPQPANSKPQK